MLEASLTFSITARPSTCNPIIRYRGGLVKESQEEKVADDIKRRIMLTMCRGLHPESITQDSISKRNKDWWLTRSIGNAL